METFDTAAAGQAAFDGCFDKIGREEGQRDGHVDLPHAALLAHAKLCDPEQTSKEFVSASPRSHRLRRQC
jgi:hypothetical protein